MSRRAEDFTVAEVRTLRGLARKFVNHRHPDPYRNRLVPGEGETASGLSGLWALNTSQTINPNSNTTLTNWDDSTVEGSAVSFVESTGIVTVNEDGLYLVTASGQWPDIPPSVALEGRTSTSGGARIPGLYDGRNFDNAGSHVDASNTLSSVEYWVSPFVFRLRAYQNGLGGATTADIEDVVLSVIQLAAL